MPSTSRSAAAAAAASVPASAPPVDPAEMLDLVANQIDKLQLVASTNKGPQPPAPLTDAELSVIASRVADVVASLPSSASPSTSDAREAALLVHVRRLVEEQLRADSSTAEWRMRAERQSKQRERLELLSKELTQRNKKMADDLRMQCSTQERAHSELRAKFESSLSSIQQSLSAHTAEREKQLRDNDALREQLSRLLQYDTAKDAAHSHALHTKELEQRLVTTQLAQAQATLDLREKQLALATAEAEQLQQREKEMQAELGAHTTRMGGVQEVMQRSGEVMEGMKGEVEKLRRRVKKEAEERLKAEEKVKESTALLLQLMEERKLEQLDLLKAKRQRDALQLLCQTLERDNRQSREREKDRGKAEQTTAARAEGELKEEEGKALTSVDRGQSGVP